MAQYLLAVHHAPGRYGADSTLAPEEAYARVDAFNTALVDAGQLVYACGLQEPATAVTASVDGVLGDGPLHPEAPQLGGFWVIEAATRTEAEAIAVRGSAACGQDLELRPMQTA